MRSRFFSIYFTITGAKKYRSLCMVQVDLLPSPPGSPRDTSSTLGLRVGNCLILRCNALFLARFCAKQLKGSQQNQDRIGSDRIRLRIRSDQISENTCSHFETAENESNWSVFRSLLSIQSRNVDFRFQVSLFLKMKSV